VLDNLEIVEQHTAKIRRNESAWNFFGALLRQECAAEQRVVDFARQVVSSAMESAAAAALSSDSAPLHGNGAYPLAARLDVLQLQARVSSNSSSVEWCGVCDDLALQDPLRAKYWMHRKGCTA
jgi:hypothetical protein